MTGKSSDVSRNRDRSKMKSGPAEVYSLSPLRDTARLGSNATEVEPWGRSVGKASARDVGGYQFLCGPTNEAIYEPARCAIRALDFVVARRFCWGFSL